MNKRLLPLLGAVILPMLSQCNSLEKDIAAINARNMEIAREPRGNYFVGRRYHVPSTRFWGYLRQPGQTWRTAQLVIMDESACRTPDRLPEYAGNPATPLTTTTNTGSTATSRASTDTNPTPT